MQQIIKCYLPHKCQMEITREAIQCLPKESGGILMGYWTKPLELVAITHIIGPGPNAEHYENRFVPDCEWQEEQIREVYEITSRRSAYLGDWHSHPNGEKWLSFKDKNTLRKISKYIPARSPNPLMGVLDGNLRFYIWCLFKTRLLFSIIEETQVIFY